MLGLRLLPAVDRTERRCRVRRHGEALRGLLLMGTDINKQLRVPMLDWSLLAARRVALVVD